MADTTSSSFPQPASNTQSDTFAWHRASVQSSCAQTPRPLPSGVTLCYFFWHSEERHPPGVKFQHCRGGGDTQHSRLRCAACAQTEPRAPGFGISSGRVRIRHPIVEKDTTLFVVETSTKGW